MTLAEINPKILLNLTAAEAQCLARLPYIPAITAWLPHTAGFGKFRRLAFRLTVSTLFLSLIIVACYQCGIKMRPG